MRIEQYEEMKKTFVDLSGSESNLWLITTNPIFSIVYDRDENTIWGGWRTNNNIIPNAVYYDLTTFDAQHFNRELYEKAINILLYKAKQENLKNKLKKIEKDFK